MKRLFPLVIILCLTLIACTAKKESAASIAKEWCDLNGKVAKAQTDAEKEVAKATRTKFENEMESKYKNDDAFMKEIETEVEKCEDASEGR